MDLKHTVVGEPCRPAVLFLHGFMGRGRDWLPVVEELAPDYYCLLPDLPGHGDTSWDKHRASWDGVADAVLQVLERRRVASCALVGYSMGGRLALYLLLQYPARFRAAVLESASPGLETAEERRIRREHDGRLAQAMESQPIEKTVRDWYDQPLFATMHKYPERLSRLIKDRENHDPHGLAAALRVMGTGQQPSLWDRLPACSTPLCLVAGELDVKFAQLARRMAGACRSAELHLVPDCGHNVHWENEAGYTRLVKGFLESV